MRYLPYLLVSIEHQRHADHLLESCSVLHGRCWYFWHVEWTDRSNSAGWTASSESQSISRRLFVDREHDWSNSSWPGNRPNWNWNPGAHILAEFRQILSERTWSDYVDGIQSCLDRWQPRTSWWSRAGVGGTRAGASLSGTTRGEIAVASLKGTA